MTFGHPGKNYEFQVSLTKTVYIPAASVFLSLSLEDFVVCPDTCITQLSDVLLVPHICHIEEWIAVPCIVNASDEEVTISEMQRKRELF